MKKRFILSLAFAVAFGQDTTSVSADSVAMISIPLTAVIESDSTLDSTQAPLPEFLPDYPPPSRLQTGEQFYDYQDDIEFLQTQIDSLKKLIRVYSKKDTMPTVDKSLLKLIGKASYSHRIMLENGTMVRGNILDKTEETIVLDTDIGKLVLDRKYIINIEQELPKAARIKLVSDPTIKLLPGSEMISGTAKNTGDKRGDFVRVVANLWGKDTELIARDSIFVNGSEIEYNSGVITDTAIEPGDSASFEIWVTYPANPDISYRTFDAHWVEIE